MAEDKLQNPYPYPTAAEVETFEGTREQKAARNIVSRHITGIPKRGYLKGDCDHAPVLKGVVDLTSACYALLDEIGKDDMHDAIEKAADRLHLLMEDHRCPES